MSDTSKYNNNAINSNILTSIFSYLVFYLLLITISSPLTILSFMILMRKFGDNIFLIVNMVLLFLAIIFKVGCKYFVSDSYPKSKIGLLYFSDTIFVSQSVLVAMYCNYLSLLLQAFGFALCGAFGFIFLGKYITIDNYKINNTIRSLIGISILLSIADIFSVMGMWGRIIQAGITLMIILLLLAKFGNKIKKLETSNKSISEIDKFILAIGIFDYIFRFTIQLTRIILILLNNKKRK